MHATLIPWIVITLHTPVACQGAWSIPQAPAASPVSTLDWATTIEASPNPDLVPDAAMRQAIIATGLPWRVRHEESGIELLLVPAGSYLRGAADDDPYDRANERPQHRVTISRPFYLGRYEVTNIQMRRFDADFSSGAWYRGESHTLDNDNQPAVDVSWLQSTAFAKRFGFRLPTEAEWEYAARAGVRTRYPWGNDINAGAGWGNIFDPACKAAFPDMDWESFTWADDHLVTAPVGAYRPNAWTFSDMFGNAWEWCADAFHDDEYAAFKGGVTDPISTDGDRRTLRGGGFGNAPRGSGIPYRFGMNPGDRFDANGFRVARDP